MNPSMNNEARLKTEPNQAVGAAQQALAVKDLTRAVFEQAGGEVLPQLELGEEVLRQVFMLLVKDYISEGKLGLALAATRESKMPQAYRLVLNALPAEAKVTRVGMDGDMQSFDHERTIQEALLGTKDESLIRQYAEAQIEKGQYHNAIQAFCVLKDAASLISLGRLLEIRFEESVAEAKSGEPQGCGVQATCSRDVTASYQEAKALGDPSAAALLLAWGDKLAGQGELTPIPHQRSWFDQNQDVNPLAAYIASELPEGFKKAAQAYLSFSSKRRTRADALLDLKEAAKLFFKAGDAQSAKETVFEIAALGHLGEAITLLKDKIALDLKLVEELIELGAERAKTSVKNAISHYLTEREGDCPFYTYYTFWHSSQSNDEWRKFTNTVSHLTGCRGSQEDLALPLYSSPEHRQKIEALHAQLLTHLLVGYMLSALSFEAQNGPSNERKYEHAAYAAWRTFSNAVERGGYNPLPDGVDVSKDPPVIRLYEAVLKFEEQASKLCVTENGWLKDTWESRRYRREHIEEVLKVAGDSYKELTERIRNLVNAL